MSDARPMIDVMDEFPDVDQFHVANPDPNYYYCWLNAKPDNLERMKNIFGYEIVAAKHKEGALVPPNAAGERKLGDVVLARMPRERYEKLMAMKKRRAESQMSAANEAWRDATEKAGLITEDTTRRTTEVLREK